MGSRKQVLMGTAVLTAAVVATLFGFWLWLNRVAHFAIDRKCGVEFPTAPRRRFVQRSRRTISRQALRTTLVAVVYVSAIVAILWFLLALAWRAIVASGIGTASYERRHTGV